MVYGLVSSKGNEKAVEQQNSDERPTHLKDDGEAD